ncbi:MAG: hypothetical protein LRY55_14175 [Leadbetterella sp.]|nr:hypothetical protein [Leadbetterella sp.]
MNTKVILTNLKAVRPAARKDNAFRFLLILTLLVQTACKNRDPLPPEVQNETEELTREEWVTRNDISLEAVVPGTNNALVMRYRVVMAEGSYKLRPDILIVRDNVVPMAEQVMLTSAQSAENVVVSVALANPGHFNNGQWFSIGYSDLLRGPDQILVSGLSMTLPGSNDLFLNYAPGTPMTVSIRTSVRQEIFDELKKQGLVNAANQENFYFHLPVNILIGK